MPSLHTTETRRGILSRHVYQLLGLYLLGFVLVILLDVMVSGFIEKLDAREKNERSRVLVGELITRDLSSLEAGTYQMAATTGVKGQQWVYGQVLQTIEHLQKSILVLEKGGTVYRETRLNIESQDVMTRVIDYQPAEGGRYVLEAIDLEPKLEQIRQKNTQLLQMLKQISLISPVSDSQAYLEQQSQIDRQMQSFPPLFTRMRENASRLFYESQKELEKISAELQSKKTFYFSLQVLLSIVVILTVLLMGQRVLRQINKSNIELQNLARDLEFMKFAMDQHAIVSITDVDGVITYVNEKFCEISGYSRDELIGKSHRLIKSGYHSRAFYRDMWDTISSGEVWHGEIKNNIKDGGYYWVAGTIVPFLDEDAKPFQYISIRTDITERKNMEETIIENNRFLQGLTDAIGEGIYAQDENGNCHYLNPEAHRLLGWTLEELQQHGLHDLVHEQFDADGKLEPAHKCHIFNGILNNQIFRSEDETFKRKNGDVFPVSIVSMPMYEKGRLAGSVTVFQDISQRKETQLLLADAKDKAERANRLKSEFLSNMSHELRTPMNAILGFSQLLDLDDELTPEQLDNVAEINKAGKHLLSLINEILDLSRIESGRIAMVLQQVELHHVAVECIKLVESLAQKNDISLKMQVSENLAMTTDYMRLKQVLLNLLSNAVKYNKPNGSVTLQIVELTEDDALQIKVSDTGAGISPDKLQEIFKPFNRLYAENSNIEGTGIGLTITKSIIEFMGGNIAVVSAAGEGSTFTVTLPMHAGAEEAVPVTSEDKDKDKKHSDAAVVTLKPGHERRRLVVYIEDNHANVRLMEALFNKLPDLQLLCAFDGETGIEMVIEHHPDLVLVDLSMPGMNGYEVLEKLRQEPQLNAMPVVAVTANALDADIQRGLQAGFANYLTKPLEFVKFNESIRRFLNVQE